MGVERWMAGDDFYVNGCRFRIEIGGGISKSQTENWLNDALKRTHTVLNRFEIVMPECYATAFEVSLKMIEPFIINGSMKVVRARGLEPEIAVS